MKKVKPKYKIMMIDGYIQKVTDFSEGFDADDISAVRSWMNGTCSFISVGNNDILNLRYVKRIKRIWRLRDHLPKVSWRFMLVLGIFWFMFMGYLILIGI